MSWDDSATCWVNRSVAGLYTDSHADLMMPRRSASWSPTAYHRNKIQRRWDQCCSSRPPTVGPKMEFVSVAARPVPQPPASAVRRMEGPGGPALMLLSDGRCPWDNDIAPCCDHRTTDRPRCNDDLGWPPGGRDHEVARFKSPVIATRRHAARLKPTVVVIGHEAIQVVHAQVVGQAGRRQRNSDHWQRSDHQTGGQTAQLVLGEVHHLIVRTAHRVPRPSPRAGSANDASKAMTLSSSSLTRLEIA